MKISNLQWTIQIFSDMLTAGEGGNISFDYPIQRKGGQWNKEKSSLLIHSALSNYPIPPLYTIPSYEEKDNEEGESYQEKLYYILDGKQRLTTIADFIQNKYSLHVETPPVINERGIAEEIAECTFSELPKKMQNKILAYPLTVYQLDDATDEEIEDVFFRLQNGSPLSPQQQAKAKMGNELALMLTDYMKHDLFKFNTDFTPAQLKKSDDEVAVVQTMMLLDESHNLKAIDSSEVSKYTLAWKENKESRDAILDKIKQALDYMHEAFGDKKEKLLLKKVHFPMAVITALYAIEKKVEPVRFADWASEFNMSYKKNVEKGKFLEALDTDYKQFGGQGSVKASNAKGRVQSMRNHFDAYMSKNETVKQEEIEKSKEELQSVVQAVTEKVVDEKPATDEKPVEEPKEEKPVEQTTTDEKPLEDFVEVVVVTDEKPKEEPKEEPKAPRAPRKISTAKSEDKKVTELKDAKAKKLNDNKGSVSIKL